MISSINPSIKALSIFIPGILLSFAFDVVTPLLFLMFIISMTFFFSDISIKKWLMFFAPLSLFAAGLAWMTMLYTDGKYATGPVIFEFLWFEVTTGSLQVGISLALRSMCFIALSLMFALTTDPTNFMMSLMQQAKLSPKVTYGILAGYRFLPTFKHELDLLRQAHRIRGISRAKGFRERFTHFKRYVVPLLANSIRKAERVAVAMESKGFTGDRNRTFFHEMTVNKRDWLFFFALVGAFCLVVFISYFFGYLNIFGRTF